MVASDGAPPRRENCGDEYWPCVFLQNLELKKSAPGSKQHELRGTLELVILPFDTAKS